jgi:hypothetical protein
MKTQYRLIFQLATCLLVATGTLCVTPSVHAQTPATFFSWNTHTIARSGQVLAKGANAILDRTSYFPDVNDGKMFSLGVFKVGEHRLLVEAGDAVQDLSFAVGYFVVWNDIYFYQNKQNILTPNRNQLNLFWDYTYNSSGAANLGEIELFVMARPQVVNFTPRAYIFGRTSDWVSPAGKTGFSSYQSFKPVTPIQSIGGSNGGKWNIFTGTAVAVNGGSLSVDGSPVVTQASLTGLGFITATNGIINLPSTTAGISASNGPIFSLAPSGTVNYASNRPISIASSAPSDSSSTGALTVAGGLGVAQDSFINGLRIGRGPGGNGLNTVVGLEALSSLSSIMPAHYLTAFGYRALKSNTIGNSSSAFGNAALFSNTSGDHNAALGAGSLYSNTTGSYNLAIGSYSLLVNTSGSFNTAVGNQALNHNTSGSNNVAIGAAAGRYAISGANTNTSNSVFIGAFSHALNDNETNTIVIGFNAESQGANTTVIGNSSTTKTYLFGETHSNSLKVSGPTTLNGQVIISAPQGDISMGIYQ